MMIAPPPIVAVDGEVVISGHEFPSLSPNAARLMAERLIAEASAAENQSRLMRGF
jgi:hypothetical protein